MNLTSQSNIWKPGYIICRQNHNDLEVKKAEKHKKSICDCDTKPKAEKRKKSRTRNCSMYSQLAFIIPSSMEKHNTGTKDSEGGNN